MRHIIIALLLSAFISSPVFAQATKVEYSKIIGNSFNIKKLETRVSELEKQVELLQTEMAQLKEMLRKKNTPPIVFTPQPKTKTTASIPTPKPKTKPLPIPPPQHPYIVIGDADIEVLSVTIAKPTVKKDFGGITTDKDIYTIIKLKITNLNRQKKLSYNTWAGERFAYKRDCATLADNRGNSYSRIRYSTATPEGRIENASIYPNESITDVLIFERPVTGFTTLTLNLIGKNVESTGAVDIIIDRSFVTSE